MPSAGSLGRCKQCGRDQKLGGGGEVFKMHDNMKKVNKNDKNIVNQHFREKNTIIFCYSCVVVRAFCRMCFNIFMVSGRKSEKWLGKIEMSI